jgi:hypothetical protein
MMPKEYEEVGFFIRCIERNGLSNWMGTVKDAIDIISATPVNVNGQQRRRFRIPVHRSMGWYLAHDPRITNIKKKNATWVYLWEKDIKGAAK